MHWFFHVSFPPKVKRMFQTGWPCPFHACAALHGTAYLIVLVVDQEYHEIWSIDPVFDVSTSR